MASTRTIPETGRRNGRPREPRRLPVSDVTLARGSAALLWVLIFLAAMGGLAAWLRPTDDPDPAPAVSDEAGAASGQAVVVASGFAERYVTAYLEAGNEGDRLTPFLGYTPELPGTARPTSTGLSAPVRAVGIEPAADDYWSVTVAVGWTGQERFWQVAVDLRDGSPNAVGLPAAVAGPPAPERSSLDVSMTQPALDDPMVESAAGFLGAYLCGQAELARFLSPGLTLAPAEPAVCAEVEIIRWGVVEGDEADSRTVVLDAQFDATADPDSELTPRVATYTLLMASRDDRWEIADILPAPPLDDAE